MVDTIEIEPTPTNRLADIGEKAPGLPIAHDRKFRIPSDQIAKTCEDLPDDQRAAIKWLAGFGRQRNLSCADLGALLRQPGRDTNYSADSIYAVLTGRREEGSIERVCEAIAELRNRMEETAPKTSVAFVETSLVRKIWATCATALARQKISFIWGPSQIGKTRALSEYAARNNHGETLMVTMPTRGSFGDFLCEMAIRLGISTQIKHQELKRRIVECFDSRTLLVVDECHQTMTARYGDRALDSLEFCREIYDRRRCGLVLCGTDVFRDGLRSNRILRQLWRRGYRPLQLPSEPSKANLDEFAAAYGLDPAIDQVRGFDYVPEDGEQVRIAGSPLKIQQAVIKNHGLGRWLSMLEDAQEMARERGTKPSWKMVLIVDHLWQQFEIAK